MDTAVLSGAAVFVGGEVEGRVFRATIVSGALALRLREYPPLRAVNYSK